MTAVKHLVAQQKTVYKFLRDRLSVTPLKVQKMTHKIKPLENAARCPQYEDAAQTLLTPRIYTDYIDAYET